MKSAMQIYGRGACRCALMAAALLLGSAAFAQVYGPQGMGGSRGGPQGPAGPSEEIPNTPVEVKPDKAARKAYTAGEKSLAKAHDLETQAAQTSDPDKKARLNDKLGDTYGQALDQFTEVLRNRPEMFDAWSKVGYVHLRLGAYREAIDDYDHALKLKPDLEEAVAHQAQAFLAVDRVEEAKRAYLELFNHARDYADQLMVIMQDWVKSHRAAANGVRQADIDSFDKWLTERQGIAKTAANP